MDSANSESNSESNSECHRSELEDKRLSTLSPDEKVSMLLLSPDENEWLSILLAQMLKDKTQDDDYRVIRWDSKQSLE
jgi:hypothetical protein